MTTETRIYILSGGAGTRLWPLSRELNPKQFYDPTNSGRPLLISAADRLKGFGKLTVLTTEALKFPTMGILRHHKIEADVLGEPLPKNTAAAVALATLESLRVSPDSLVGVFPADHLITDQTAFETTLRFALKVASEGNVVTLGIRPSFPATAYGYMEVSNSDWTQIQALKVAKFIEKPNKRDAEKLLQQGNVVWNAGIFVFPAKRMAALFQEHMPELWHNLENLNVDQSNLDEIYCTLPSKSVDYGIMERMTDLACVPALEMGWSDVGSWEEVARKGQTLGKPIEVDAERNFYTGLTPRQKRIAFVGVSDLMVVDTPDALLIAKHGEGQRVREVVDKLKAENSALTRTHAAEERPWGRFEILADNDHFKSKRITMWAGQRLSYQSHAKRAEHWVIIKGVAEITLNDEVFRLEAGEHIYIPLLAKHRIANPAKSEAMEFIEVQTGSYFGEDDITRYEDDYGRS